MKNVLFTPLKLRDVTFRNRIFLSPMDQYKAKDGMPNAWHLMHYGSRAVGGAGCLIQEATAVLPAGRISSGDLGMWADAHVEASKPMVRFIKEQGCIPGIQLGHSGRKGSTGIPWESTGYVAPSDGGWDVAGPSAVPFDEKSPKPCALTEQEIKAVVGAFAKAAERCAAAGYEAIDLHAAHGYLMHEFLSPLSNKRADSYGGSLENRMRLTLEIAEAVRKVWPERLPLIVRISATDWADEGGWDLDQSIVLCSKLKEKGVDLIDVSTGGLIPGTKIVTGPGYQVRFAQAIKEKVQIPVGAVGQIVNAHQAEQIVAGHQADAVFIGRAFLRDPSWPLRAAHDLGETVLWPKPYERAKPFGPW